jgi:hypothetical protein
MNCASEDVKDILEAESSLGLVFATNLFIGLEPPMPNNSVTIFDTPGYPPMLTLSGGTEKFDRPSVQVRVRNAGYTTGWDLINDIKVLLQNVCNSGPVTWNGTVYMSIRALNDPFLLDWDDKIRPRFVCNFDIERG